MGLVNTALLQHNSLALVCEWMNVMTSALQSVSYMMAHQVLMFSSAIIFICSWGIFWSPFEELCLLCADLSIPSGWISHYRFGCVNVLFICILTERKKIVLNIFKYNSWWYMLSKMWNYWLATPAPGFRQWRQLQFFSVSTKLLTGS